MRNCFRFQLSIIAALLLSGINAGYSYGASIKAISKAKGLVQIDEGTDSGLKKGTEVCFGDKKTKGLGCGAVTSAKKNTAIVKPENAALVEKLKKGMPVHFEAASIEVADEDATNAGPAAGAHRRNIELMQISSLMHSFTANKIGYLAPPAASGTSASTLWASSGTPDYSVIGFGVKGELPIGKKYSLALGGRIIMIRGFSSIDSYLNTGTSSISNEYVETTQTFSDMGFWGDFYLFEIPLGKKFIIRSGAGLDLDLSSVIFSAMQKDDRASQATQGNFAKAALSMKTISLRIPISLNLFFNPIGLNVTPVLGLPLFGSFSGTATSADTNASRLSGGTAADDLKTSLGMKKNSISFMMQAGAYWAF